MHRKNTRYTSPNYEGLYDILSTNSSFYNRKNFSWYYCIPASRVNESMFPRKEKEATIELNVVNAEDTTNKVASVAIQKKSEIIVLKEETKNLYNNAGVTLPLLIWSDNLRLFCQLNQKFSNFKMRTLK